MSVALQHRRGATSAVSSFTGLSGEFVYNTTTHRLHAQDGAAAGGYAHALLSEVVLVGSAAGGDLSGTYPNPTVARINGVAISLAGAFTTSGASALTLTTTGPTNVTLPTTGTLATLAGAEEFTNKTLNASVGKGTWTASGTWTLPAFTLGGVVSGGGNQINNVVIGNTTPLAGSFTTIAASNTLTITKSSGTNAILINNGAADVFYIDRSNGNVTIWNTITALNNFVVNVNVADRMTIGTAGAVRFHNYGAGTLVTDASGNITASSDARLKDEVKPFDRSLPDVLKLNPISFRWNEKSGMETEGTYVGFLAQDVALAVPEAVSADSTGVMSLSDRPLIAVLVNSVKEFDRRLRALEDARHPIEGGCPPAQD